MEEAVVEVAAVVLELRPRLRRLHLRQLRLLAAVVEEVVAVVVGLLRRLLAARPRLVVLKHLRNFLTTLLDGPCRCRWESK